VSAFQAKYGHRVSDGLVGPGTRERLASELLHQFSPSIFARFRRPEAWSRPSVFISYATADRERLNKVDQWLRDHGLRVVRDCQFFVAGTTIQENIVRALADSDKILAVLSSHSRDRDWPRLERELAEQVEAKLGAPVLFEGKFFRKGGIDAARRELVSGIYQCFYYLAHPYAPQLGSIQRGITSTPACLLTMRQRMGVWWKHGQH